MSRPDPYAAMRFAGYRWFISGRAFSVLALQMQTIAVSWQIYQRLKAIPHEAALALGYIGLVQVLPVLLFSIPAGQFVDRFDRRLILMGTQLLMAICSVLLLFLSLTHAPTCAFYGVLFLGGIARAFTAPALNAYYTMLVPREVLPNAATWNSTVFELTSMIGPAAGGLIVAQAGPETSYLVNLACVAMSFTLFVFAVTRSRVIIERSPLTWHSLLSGVHFVFGTRCCWPCSAWIYLPFYWVAQPRCCPSTRTTSCMAGPMPSGFCVPRRPWAQSVWRSLPCILSRGDTRAELFSGRCSVSALPLLSLAYLTRFGFRSSRSRSPGFATTSAWSSARP